MKQSLALIALLCLPMLAQQPRAIQLPSKLVAQVNAGTPGSVTLSCTDSLAGVSFNIYRASSSGAYTTPLNPTPLVTCSYTDIPAPGSVVFYVARGVINGVSSGNSNEVTAAVPPPAPTGLTLTQN